ncbi:MAG: hypothetical protein LUM44_07320 [Pyrinomonadaceae bacterium]|nr:hypothetical protein [Pyrinomonadaceae bacterium]
MKRKSLNSALCLLLCNLLFLSYVLPQELDPLGPMRFSSPAAPRLLNPTRINIPKTGGGMRPLRLSFLGRVGGVAFDGVAKPEGKLVGSSIRLKYTPGKSDGNRLSIILNGKEISTSIYDWQLIPIANFADDPNYSCVTMFGTLGNKDEDISVRRKGGKIINYHPAFTNNLLGVRLLQLDGLILKQFNSYDLPKLKGKYLLGNGESEPNADHNKKAWETFFEYLYENANESYNSYLVSDYDRITSFGIKDDKLVLEGDPSYYFWSFDDGGLYFYDKEFQESKKIDNELQLLVKKNSRFNSKKWVYDKLLIELKKYDEQIGLNSLLEEFGALAAFELAENTDPNARQKILSYYSLEELKPELATLRTMTTTVKAKELSEMNLLLSDKTELVRAINPAVWDAGTAVMRYSAFFRYIKKTSPIHWNNFIKQIKDIKIQPAINTPTVITYEREGLSFRKDKSELRNIKYDAVSKNIH